MTRRLGGAVAALLLLVATGCQDGDPDDSGGEATERTSPTTTPPTVEPASGLPVEVPRLRVRAPEGWEAGGMSVRDIQTVSAPSGSADSMVVSYIGQGAPGQDLDDQVDLARGSLRDSLVGIERLADVEVAAEPAYHLQGTDSFGATVDEFGALDDTHLVVLRFTLDGSDAERQKLIDSVLASWEWTGEGPG